jgi:uncharacterized membrane protein
MPTTYDQLAGKSVERLAALSDGIFAVAMTLLALDLHAPAAAAVHGEHDLWRALAALAPRLLMYGMSFMTLGIFWLGQQTQLHHLSRSDRSLTWIHLGFLCTVAVMPFSTQLLAELPTLRLALVVYWLNILLLGAALYASWVCAVATGLVKADLPPDASQVVRRRIVIAQALYAAGALLCVVSTYWSMAFIIAVQLNFVLAPRWRRRATAARTPADPS